MLNHNAIVRVAGLAARQFGRITWRQLIALGVDKRSIHEWVHAGYLYRALPGVYAVGHVARTTEADLAAAVLYSGPEAMLSLQAAWWVGLATSRPYLIEVSTPPAAARSRASASTSADP